jgi:hypothetical protein
MRGINAAADSQRIASGMLPIGGLVALHSYAFCS